MDGKKDMDCILTQNIRGEQVFYADMAVVFAVAGPMQVMVNGADYTMCKGDVVLIHPGEKHAIQCAAPAAVCMAVYSSRFLATLFRPYGGAAFACNSLSDAGRDYTRIRGIFRELIQVRIDTNRKSECGVRSLLYRLLDCLSEEFSAEKGERCSVQQGTEDGRMQQVFRYIDENFSGNISLSVLAEQMYLSPSTLSRLFKKNTGVYFAEYILQMRLDYARQALLDADDSITRIAVDSGFSNLSTFNRVFKERFGVSPSEYRRAGRPDARGEQPGQPAVSESLRKAVDAVLFDHPVSQVDVDVRAGQTYEKFWNRAINAGAASALLMANVQAHIVFLAENLGFRYVRLWNVFSVPMRVTDGRHIGSYSYDQLDSVIDFLDRHGLFPFLDFGVRPSTAVKNERVNVYFGEECVEFASREAWERMVEDFVRHIVKRYGKEKAERWIFEISYDIRHKSPCYKDARYDFFDAYRHLYRTVKRALPAAEVGGPMAIGHCGDDFVRSFLEKSKAALCVPDFVSLLLFPYVPFEDGGQLGYRRTADGGHERRELERMHALLREAGVSSRVYVSEWNNTLSSRDFLNDSCYRAAYFADKLAALWGKADLACVWMASDWVSNYFDVQGVANGGNGLLTKDAICKPACYALQFMNQLGDELLVKGENYWVTRSGRQDFYILCAHFKPLDTVGALRHGCAEHPTALQALAQDEACLELVFRLRHVEGTRYVVKRRILTPKEGSLLCEWEKLGFDTALNSRDIAYLRRISFPRISMKKCEATASGELEIREKLGAQETVLLHIYEE